MIVAAPLLAALAAWAALLWITSRPDASYVGTPLTPHEIAIRRLTFAIRRMERQIAEAMTPVFEYLARASRAFMDAYRSAIEEEQ